jgi:very-short-patch-repair endonuclease
MSPLERDARHAVLDTGYKFQQEYELGPYRYDIAIPALRLLIEVDSKRWHSHPSRIARDRKKTELAKKEGWTLTRVSSKHAESVEFLVKQSVLRRESELTLDQDR